MGRSLGKGMREFKEAISSKDDDEKVEPAELPPAVTTPVEDEPVSASSTRERDT
jgi:Sec-independent protein translocase protein TatA